MIVSSTPYPWPYTGLLSPSETALVVCCAGDSWPAGSLGHDALPAANLARLRSLATSVGLLTVLVDNGRLAARRGQASGVSASAALNAERGELVTSSVGTDGFYGGPLEAELRRERRRCLILAGIGLETAVHSTLRGANDRGYECLTVIDACVPLDHELVDASASMIEMSGGIFGAVATTAAVEAALGAARSQPTESPDRMEDR